jgi:hypothetical protein
VNPMTANRSETMPSSVMPGSASTSDRLTWLLTSFRDNRRDARMRYVH